MIFCFILFVCITCQAMSICSLRKLPPTVSPGWCTGYTSVTSGEETVKLTENSRRPGNPFPAQFTYLDHSELWRVRTLPAAANVTSDNANAIHVLGNLWGPHCWYMSAEKPAVGASNTVRMIYLPLALFILMQGGKRCLALYPDLLWTSCCQLLQHKQPPSCNHAYLTEDLRTTCTSRPSNKECALT